jgi:patatin-like phospholipase/acyl hydrolase
MVTRILALDGGGARGIFTASALNSLHGSLGVSADNFDLIAGTSTGSIIALALSIGMTPADILQSYKRAVGEVFGTPRSRLRRLTHPKHSNANLTRWLEDMFGDRVMNDAKVPVLIPTYDVTIGQPRVWKPDYRSYYSGGGKLKMLDVALTSCAAPVYLPGVSLSSDLGTGAYLDGGLWANNPSLVGYVEAIRSFGAMPSDIRLVSIGTGKMEKWFKTEDVLERGLNWALDLFEIQLQAVSQSTHETITLLLGENGYCRVNVSLAEPIALDDVTNIELLETLGIRCANESRAHVARVLDIVHINRV